MYEDKKQEQKEQKEEKTPQMIALETKLSEVLSQNQNLQEQLTNLNDDKAAEADAESARLAEESRLKLLLGGDKTSDIDDLSNKELVNIIADAVDSAIDGRLKLAESAMVKQLDITNQSVNHMKKAMIDQFRLGRLNSAKEKYDDFDDLQSKIIEAINRNPSLDPEDAYFIVKGKMSGEVPNRRHTESERPNSYATDRDDSHRETSTRRSDDRPVGGSRGSFRDIMNKGIDKVLEGRKRR